MEEKNKWMFSFLVVLVICIVLIVLQVGGMTDQNYKRKYEDLKTSTEQNYKTGCDLVKKSYIELAQTHSKMLSGMMLKHDLLKSNYPAYKDLTDEELDKRVRLDIGRLEAEVERLQKEK